MHEAAASMRPVSRPALPAKLITATAICMLSALFASHANAANDNITPPLQQAAASQLSVRDDSQRTVTLARPAQRIVSLSPHTTEMLFAIGAGAVVVGVVQFSDYPPEAQSIPSVGSGLSVDMERLVQLQPDLVVAWHSGNSASQLKQMRELGLTVYESEPLGFDAIASSLERLSVLTGTTVQGQQQAAVFRARLAALSERYRAARPVSVFYQVWRAPLMTLNRSHPVSHALKLCGARNIFEDLPQIAPTVGIESVIQADPDIIIASGGEQGDLLGQWRRFPTMKAVKSDNMKVIDGALMNRSGPRILDGTEILCRELDAARARLASTANR